MARSRSSRKNHSLKKNNKKQGQNKQKIRKEAPTTSDAVRFKPIGEIQGIPAIELSDVDSEDVNGHDTINEETIEEETGSNTQEEGEWQTVRKQRHSKGNNFTPNSSISSDKSKNMMTLSVEDVEEGINFWKSAIVCFVLGANPPIETMQGFFNRIWGKKGLDKVSSAPNGIFVVRFKTVEERDVILKAGHHLFDNKPLIHHFLTARYVRLVMSRLHDGEEEIKRYHPRFYELRRSHGLDEERHFNGGAGPQKMSSGLLTITLKCVGASMGEKTPLSKKLPATTTVGKLKILSESFFKLKSVKIRLFLQEESSYIVAPKPERACFFLGDCHDNAFSTILPHVGYCKGKEERHGEVWGMVEDGSWVRKLRVVLPSGMELPRGITKDGQLLFEPAPAPWTALSSEVVISHQLVTNFPRGCKVLDNSTPSTLEDIDKNIIFWLSAFGFHSSL